MTDTPSTLERFLGTVFALAGLVLIFIAVFGIGNVRDFYIVAALLSGGVLLGFTKIVMQVLKSGINISFGNSGDSDE